MKNSHIFFGFITLFFVSFFMASCLNEDNKIPPNCYDGELNNGEEMIDCGGPCPKCDPCLNGVWNPELGETWVDCGGDCGECSQCWNGCQDGDEVGVDCGGSCPNNCADLCGDGLPNGTEDGADPNCIAPDMSLVDCGGAYCDPCPTCDDGLLNGNEIGIDCGGPDCDPCATDGSCINGIQDGDEQWINCGGTICPPCQDTLHWEIGPDVYICFGGNKAIDITGGTVTVTGTTLNGDQIGLSIPEPLGGWAGQTYPLVISCNPNLPANQLAFTDFLGNAFSSAFNPSAGTVVVKAIDPASGGIFVADFSGNLYMVDEMTSTTISNGFTLMNVP